ncbi:MAG: UDP-glucose 4-epimerase GalE [Lachnospiraceae bacterium]
MRILLAGGAGYIGAHCAVELLNAGHEVVIVDDYRNSSPLAVKRVETITGKKIAAYECDICDKVKMREIFSKQQLDCIIHLAGLKAVGESVSKPVEYYRNNIDTTLTLLECMQEAGVKRIVFSSSATVYGQENAVPYDESMQRGSCTNPYGWTKSMMEQILEDAAKADPELSVLLLRYFNPVGAHESGLIGEDPKGIPNNLMPYIAQVAVGKLEHLTVYGNDYPSPDGTGLRDYIHVADLAMGHLKAVEYVRDHKGVEIINLGTGKPYSVLQMVEAFEKASDRTVKYEIGPRRPGDLAACWADVCKSKQLLGWEATRGLEDMCRDTWRWQKNNPEGYQ